MATESRFSESHNLTSLIESQILHLCPLLSWLQRNSFLPFANIAQKSFHGEAFSGPTPTCSHLGPLPFPSPFLVPQTSSEATTGNKIPHFQNPFFWERQSGPAAGNWAGAKKVVKAVIVCCIDAFVVTKMMRTNLKRFLGIEFESKLSPAKDAYPETGPTLRRGPPEASPAP
ncbi:hypothetical protein H8959_001524 [Pygathrix nigripes]